MGKMMTGKMMTRFALGISALGLLGFAGLAVATETTDSLVIKLTAAVSDASRANAPIVPAVSTTIEASGASPEIVTAALTRLLGECPAGELLAELRRRAPDQVPLWCGDDTIDGLRGLRAISLAQLEATGGATGATGATGNGGGLASPPAGVGSANGSSFSLETASN
jgi:hypothetical protein